jgi:hypothetical protein
MTTRPFRLRQITFQVMGYGLTVEQFDQTVILPSSHAGCFSFGRYLIMFEKI